jgi:formate hydrogenlyase subunit 4
MIDILLGCLAQTVLLLALAPGLNGVIKALKARLQTRQGPPLRQGYADLRKWLGKQPVYSEHASWVSRAAPVVSFAAILCAGVLMTTVLRRAPLGLSGDLIAVVYLFALARFATALGGLDAAGAFGGMGSSREMAIAALAEPVLLLSLFSLAARAGGSSLTQLAASAPGLANAGALLAFAALYVVVLAETGRVPIDNPDTHLELTMVHEGMILEASGPDLALYHWGAMIKQLLLLSLLADLFLPWGLATTGDGPGALAISAVLYLLKLVVLAVALAVTETGMAKLRIFRVPDLMGTAFALALLGLAAGPALHA